MFIFNFLTSLNFAFIHIASRKLLSVSLVSLLLTVLVSCLCETPTEPDQAPLITNQTLFASETISDAEDIGRVIPTDPENSALTFAIVTHDSNVIFELSSNGVLSLSNGQSLDYDRMSNHSLVVSVFGGELSNTATVTVEVRSNQAPILAITNFRIAETIFETNVIGRIVAVSEGAREVFTYQVVSNTNLFELDTNSGDLSLVAGQFLDYERTNRHSLSVGVFDGELSNTLTISVEVEDVSLANGDAYCGDLTEFTPVIDGSEHPFFLSGTGIEADPYVVPVRADCRDITFIHDPEYTNGVNSYLSFQFTLSQGRWRIHLQLIESIDGQEGLAWQVIAPPMIPLSQPEGHIFTTSVPRTTIFPTSGPIEVTNVVTANFRTNKPLSDLTRRWRSKKGLRFTRHD